METRQYSISFWSVMKTIKTENDVADCSEDSINVVFVLGESFAKAHSSLYGYPLPTTPYSVEEKENGNLYLFEDLISPYSLTTPTMHSVMCLNSIADGEQWYESIFSLKSFRKQVLMSICGTVGKTRSTDIITPFLKSIHRLLLHVG